MKTLNNFALLLFIVTISFLSFSCSNGNEEPVGSSSLTINDRKIGKVYNAQCIDRHYSEMLGGDYTTVFEMQFEYDQELTIFSIEWPIKTSQLREGMDLLNEDEPESVTFRGVMSIEVGVDYEDFEGKVIVQSISSESVTLKYSNFTFLKSSGHKSYAINGTMTYNLN